MSYSDKEILDSYFYILPTKGGIETEAKHCKGENSFLLEKDKTFLFSESVILCTILSLQHCSQRREVTRVTDGTVCFLQKGKKLLLLEKRKTLFLFVEHCLIKYKYLKIQIQIQIQIQGGKAASSGEKNNSFPLC